VQHQDSKHSLVTDNIVYRYVARRRSTRCFISRISCPLTLSLRDVSKRFRCSLNLVKQLDVVAACLVRGQSFHASTNMWRFEAQHRLTHINVGVSGYSTKLLLVIDRFRGMSCIALFSQSELDSTFVRAAQLRCFRVSKRGSWG
jgi:hypothetical protein